MLYKQNNIQSWNNIKHFLFYYAIFLLEPTKENCQIPALEKLFRHWFFSFRFKNQKIVVFNLFCCALFYKQSRYISFLFTNIFPKLLFFWSNKQPFPDLLLLCFFIERDSLPKKIFLSLNKPLKQDGYIGSSSPGWGEIFCFF